MITLKTLWYPLGDAWKTPNQQERVNQGRKLACRSQESPVTGAGSALLPCAGWRPSSFIFFKSIWVSPNSNPYLVVWTAQQLPASRFGFLLPPDSDFCLGTVLQKIVVNVVKNLTFCFLEDYYVFCVRFDIKQFLFVFPAFLSVIPMLYVVYIIDTDPMWEKTVRGSTYALWSLFSPSAQLFLACGMYILI